MALIHNPRSYICADCSARIALPKYAKPRTVCSTCAHKRESVYSAGRPKNVKMPLDLGMSDTETRNYLDACLEREHRMPWEKKRR